jgi:hypothetical protein
MRQWYDGHLSGKERNLGKGLILLTGFYDSGNVKNITLCSEKKKIELSKRFYDYGKLSMLEESSLRAFKKDIIYCLGFRPFGFISSITCAENTISFYYNGIVSCADASRLLCIDGTGANPNLYSHKPRKTNI